MAISNSPAQDYNQSDYSNSARLQINGSAQEQKFFENLLFIISLNLFFIFFILIY